ncbi:MAG: caspase family protein, partial [Bacteroidota bacterium]
VTTFNRGLKATSTQTDRWKENSFLIDYKAQDKFSIVEKKKSHSIYGNIDYAVIPLNANDSVILKKRVPFSPAFFIDLPSNRPVLDEESIVVDETNKLIIESFGDTINVFNFRSELLYSKVGLDVSYFFVRNNHTWGFDDGSDFGNDFAGWDYIDPEEPQYDTISNPFEFYYYKELVVSDNVLLGMAYLGRFEAIFPILYRIDKKSKKLEYLESKINHFNKIEVDYDFLGVVDEKYGLSIVNDSSLIFWDIATQNIRWEIPILEGISYDNQLPIILEEKGIAVYHHKDVVKFYDLENKKALINLIITSDGEWIAWNENGQFDGTRAIEEIVFEKDLTLIEVTQLKDRFYEPNLLQKVLGKSKEPLRKSRGLNNIDLYPKIKLGHPDQNRGKLNIGLYNQGGGYGAVTIAINGKEVISDVRNSDFSYNADSVTLTYDIKNHPFLKVGEVNTIEVSAYNSEEYLVSRPQKLYYIPKGKKDDYEPTLHAIIVGTANYSGNDLDLKYPAKDALSFASALKLSSDNLLGIDKTNIQVLTTDSQDQLYPTKENIKNTYQKIAKEAKPYDALVLYFAGHGVNYGGVEGDFYYITSDAYNANLKDPVVRENVSISSNELTEWIKDIPALKQVLIFDACHSGQFAEDLLAKRDLRSASEIRSLERMKDRTGMYILSGSAADAVSYEASVYGQGLLTYALLFGMKGASLRDGKFVDVVQLFQFAANKVPELAENIGGVQKPEIRVPYGGESFDIGLLESKDKDKIKLPSPKPLFIRSGFQNQITFADDLELSDLINQKLKDLQASEDNRIIFVDASKFSNAYSIRGLYIEEKDRINLKANLIKDGSIVGSFSDNASSKDKLIIDIFSWLEESLSSRQN